MLIAVPLSFDAAADFVRRVHRHHTPPVMTECRSKSRAFAPMATATLVHSFMAEQQRLRSLWATLGSEPIF